MDPLTLGGSANPATSAAASLFGSLFGGGLGGSAAPATSAADSVFSTNLGFDNSGWNISFGQSSIAADVEKRTEQGADLAGATSVSSLNQYLPYAMLFIGALIAWKTLKK